MELEPDVLVVVGDDQRELFLDDCMPAISVFWGDKLWDRPPGPDAYPATMDDAYKWYHAEVDDPYVTSPGSGVIWSSSSSTPISTWRSSPSSQRDDRSATLSLSFIADYSEGATSP